MSSKIKVIAHVHPFAPAERTEREYEAGTLAQDIIKDLVPPVAGRIVMLSQSGEPIQPNEAVTTDAMLRVFPAGTQAERNNVGKGAGWAFVGGAILFTVGLFTANPFLMYSGAALVAGGGLTGIGVSLLSNILPGETGAGVSSQSLPSIRGGRNRAAQWAPVPIVYGTHLVAPYYGAKPYTSIGGTDGVDQFLHVLLVVSRLARTGGNVLLSNIKIGETILATNAGAQLNGAITVDGPFTAEAQVYNNGTNPTLYPETVTEDQIGLDLDSTVSPDSLWRATTPNTSKVSIDIIFPRGLFKYNDNGALSAHTVTVTVKRRVAGSGTPWASATTVQTWNLSKAIARTLRYNFTETLAAGQYEYAMTRSTNDPDGFRGTSAVQWGTLRSIKNGVRAIEAVVAAGLCVLAIKIKATADLNGSIDQINVIAAQSVNIFSGGNWASTGYSSNPADIFRAALTGPVSPRPVSTSLVDDARLQEWHATCAAKGWTCNIVLSGRERTRDVLQTISRTGRAAITLRDSLTPYSVVVDDSKTTVVQHFTPRNTRNFSWSKAFADYIHGYRITFISAADGYAPNEIVALADGYKYDTNGDGVLRDWNGVDRTADPAYTTATKFEQLEVPGVTSSSNALKYGRFLLAVQRLRPETYSFEADIEAVIAEPGDYVRVAHDAIAVSLASGRVKGVTLDGGGQATAIQIDESVTFESGKSYAVRIRRTVDNATVYAPVSGASGVDLTFTVPISAGSVPAVGDLVVFGEAGIETLECVVAGREATADLGYRLTCVARADAIHSADSGVIPPYVSRVSRAAQIAATPAPPSPITAAAQAALQQAQADDMVKYFESAFIGFLEAEAIKVRKSIRGGDRYDEDGNLISAGSPGFYIGVNGRTFVSGMEIQGEGIIPEWIRAAQVGNSLAIGAIGSPALAALNGTDVAFIDLANGSLRTYRFNGATWAQLGSSLAIATAGAPALAAINSTDVAYINSFNNSLGTYRFNGATWAQVGVGLGVTGTGNPSLAALNATDVAFIDSGNDSLRTYRFNGTSWAQVGSGLAIATVGLPAITALNGSDIAFIDDVNMSLRTYRFNGTDWAQVGNSLAIGAIGSPALAALNGTDVAFIDSNNDSLRICRFDGTNWAQVGSSLAIATIGLPALASLNGTDVAFIDNTNASLRTYRFAFTTSQPHSRLLTG